MAIADSVITGRQNNVSDSVGYGSTTPDELDLQPCKPCRDSVSQNLRRRLFNRFNILRSSPFRLAMVFWLLFTSCFGIGLFGFYATLQGQLLGRIDSIISVRFQQVLKGYEETGLEQVLRVAEIKSKSPMTSSLGFSLFTQAGEFVAGNIAYGNARPGWHVVTGKELGLEGDNSPYRFYTDKVGDHVFSLGKSMNDLVQLRHIALVCVLWMLAISTVLSFGVALLVAQRVRRRLGNISKSMNDVAAGNLLARLPVTSAGDDIDLVSEQINLSLDRLKLTVDGMRQVSTDIAHDLKTPLNRLFITLEEAAAKSRAGHCVGDDLEFALDEANAINGTFEALLRIAQIEAGARKAQFKLVNLKDILETAAEVYTAVVEENGQVLTVDISHGLNGVTLPVMGDRDLLLQLVVNLIENSVNHCKADTEIVLSANEDGDGVWFSVSDSGPGIPEHERQKVFQRLYRLERSRTKAGTGLGLSMVKAIADLHQATISLSDNNPGLRTVIKFCRS